MNTVKSIVFSVAFLFAVSASANGKDIVDTAVSAGSFNTLPPHSKRQDSSTL